MAETVSHTSLSKHSAPFSLNGGMYQANVSGTIQHGSEAIELQRLVNGSFVQLDPPVRFLANEIGGSKATGVLPAGTYRWTVPQSMLGNHSINTNVVHT
ncbi:hypothetical protein H8A95_21945 [Bradyrhizobium sp. Pear76]|uniref:hypothetical protein n=1 Tax=Bradyrhizobium oropedii TaxID=1571201 RepID=UPI001E411E67|nr:hypothetical protein [Bradyrhizobium oropedii]MCC8964901.1 hypothetical protein [Bradyrhizobium oropedii]